jgi:hypothetical protein
MKKARNAPGKPPMNAPIKEENRNNLIPSLRGSGRDESILLTKEPEQERNVRIPIASMLRARASLVDVG